MLDLCLPAFGRKLRTSVVTVPPADGWAVQHVMTNLRAFCKVTWSSQFVWLDILSYSRFCDYHWCSSVLNEWRFGKTADATLRHCLLWVVAWAEPLRLPLISLGHALTYVIQGEKGFLNIFFWTTQLSQVAAHRMCTAITLSRIRHNPQLPILHKYFQCTSK